MPYEIEATATSVAKAEVLFKHLAVAEAWNEWGSFPTRARRVSEGEQSPNGVGAIRKIPPAREKVVEYDPPGHYAYVALSGLPVRDYRAVVDFEDQGTSSLVRWHARFDPLIPGTGPLLRVFFQRMLNSFAHRVARHAEHCEPGCPARLPNAL
ncbi:SRPBCC family protein [Spirillospora sp. CA-294931]|uniref:SRPBCC family protein n=1 Tax=Spirillospora sp. CA-294931 TaxID=3240042 RepID=UPI003D907C62